MRCDNNLVLHAFGVLWLHRLFILEIVVYRLVYTYVMCAHVVMLAVVRFYNTNSNCNW
jgi:hypothetical protein